MCWHNKVHGLVSAPICLNELATMGKCIGTLGAHQLWLQSYLQQHARWKIHFSGELLFENLSKNFAKPKFEETDLYKKVFRKSFKRWIRRRRRRGQSLSCLTWPVRFRPVHFLCVAFDPFFFSFDLKNNVIQISTEPTYGTVLVAELAERWPLTLEVHSSNPIFVWHVWWEKLVRNGLFFIYFRSF